MDLLAKYSIPTPPGKVASSVDQVMGVAKSLESEDLVLKAQVLCGGRGKGVFDNGFKGGVQVVYGADEATNVAKLMLGHKLFTKQTGLRGRPCNTVYIVPRVFCRKEYYLALLLDRASKGLCLVGSKQGGVNIEAVAQEDPSAITSLKVPDEIAGEKFEQNLKSFFNRIGIRRKKIDEAISIARQMITLTREKDVTLLEINPFVETIQGSLLCLDAKITIDDNSEFRNQEIFRMRDWSQEDQREVESSKANLNYIGLDGDIGCLVNGAGLAMATMDIIKLHGGSPANFLDVGGSATQDQIDAALKILNKDPSVKAIFINIFGGIIKCDVVARGIVEAINAHQIRLPIVVRLLGTNTTEAKAILKASAVQLFTCDDFNEAALKSVKLSEIVKLGKEADVAIQLTKNH